MQTQPCEHTAQIRDVQPSANGCEECLKTGSTWVELRECLICGHVGCCDSSPGRHATKHYQSTNHPVMQSFQSGKTWRWCYVDERMV
ncbi:MAG TPA: UBP-type zinc finger domain-containing protein [Candidatus Baltobacteraceae bacterium]|nr:UBP-type zinc finger domain-containing protein [Candidatus Baltobacteraceae bacterium]